MKKLGGLVLAAGMLLGVSGCAPDDADLNVRESAVEMTVHLNDGREVLCIVVDNYSNTSCDWPNAR